MLAEDVAQQILDSAEESRQDKDLLRVTMDLPPMREVPLGVLAEALSIVLSDYRITLPEEVYKSIREGATQEVSFLAPGLEKELRPRTVVINCSPEIRTLSIQGEPPLDGLDGFVELFFDFKVRSGRIRANGTIDFREINRFPQAKGEQLLLREYEPTMGLPGTDVRGLPISPEPGKKFPIKAGEGIEIKRGYDKDRDRHCQDYYALKPGIIVTDFAEGNRDPAHIREISVRNQLVVGDVDFSTGNIGQEEGEIRCAADVVINGDIRGRFAVVVDGHMEVKGAVEGETVDVTGSLIASFVRSSVRASATIQAGAARGAKLRAEKNVIITREATQCEIIADFFEIRPEGVPEVLMGNTYIEAHRIVMERVAIRNVVEIRLGEDLFELSFHLSQQEDALQKRLRHIGASLRDQVSVFSTRLKNTLDMWGEAAKNELAILKLIVAKLLKGEITRSGGKERVSEWIQRVSPGLQAVGKKALKIFEIKELEHKVLEELEEIGRQKKELKEEISRLRLQIKGILAGDGRLIVRCNDMEYKYLPDPRSGDKTIDLNLAYIPEKGLEEIVSSLVSGKKCAYHI